MKRLCLVCEVMHGPLDEGIRIVAAQLARALATHHRMKLLLLSGEDGEIDGLKIHGALANKYFLSKTLAALVGEFRPDGVVYVPWTSLTPRTILRARALKSYAAGAPIAVVALQPRPAGPLERLAGIAGRPDVVLVAGPATRTQAETLGIRAHPFTPGVELSRFRPASPSDRAELKRRAGIDPQVTLILHVGHMKSSRNVGVLVDLTRLEGVACALVASTSTMADRETGERLAAAGVTVMTHHQERIEFAYRMADIYLFPVVSPTDAIETPLSVLEAAACDLPIVSTPFGGLPDLLGDDAVWARTPAEMVEAVRRLAADRRESAGGGRRIGVRSTRTRVERLTWVRSAEQVLEALAEAAS